MQRFVKRVSLGVGALAIVASIGLALAQTKPIAQDNRFKLTTPVHPTATSIVPSPVATSSIPAVAGASTVAPAASSAPISTPTSPVRSVATVASTSKPSPAPAAKLVLSIKGVASAYAVDPAAITNACDILTAAKTQGFLHSVTLKYYSSFGSDYVAEINGFANNWEYKVNGVAPRVGCSKIPITQGDTVTWTYQ